MAVLLVAFGCLLITCFQACLSFLALFKLFLAHHVLPGVFFFQLFLLAHHVLPRVFFFFSSSRASRRILSLTTHYPHMSHSQSSSISPAFIWRGCFFSHSAHFPHMPHSHLPHMSHSHFPLYITGICFLVLPPWGCPTTLLG